MEKASPLRAGFLVRAEKNSIRLPFPFLRVRACIGERVSTTDRGHDWEGDRFDLVDHSRIGSVTEDSEGPGESS